MESKETKAITFFRSGFNCAQAVVSAFSDELAFDKELALKIACGFGGGMGRLQETCGAVTGSFMILGVYNSKIYSGNQDRKDRTYSMVQEFAKAFIEIHGTINCKSLLGCDLKTEEGHSHFKENKLNELVCEKCISDSIRIIDDIIIK
jgi:C_GCAxxG_C_C family probable redox protein